MTKFFERLSTSFVRTFGTSFLFYSTGILASPNLEGAGALALAAGSASIAAGLRAVQEAFLAGFGVEISFKPALGKVWGAYADAFALAGVGTLLTLAATWFAAPDLANWRTAWVTIFVGAATAGARAVQGLFTRGEFPLPDRGFRAAA